MAVTSARAVGLEVVTYRQRAVPFTRDTIPLPRQEIGRHVVLGKSKGNYTLIRVNNGGEKEYRLISNTDSNGSTDTKVDENEAKTIVETREIPLETGEANISRLWNYAGDSLWKATQNGNLELESGSRLWVTFKNEEIVEISTSKPPDTNSVAELTVQDDNSLQVVSRSNAPLAIYGQLEALNWPLYKSRSMPQPPADATAEGIGQADNK